MSDKIRIKSILLENYRQYYGEVKIDFSSREEGFTIIAGKNGEGKSNLLNAISWCLYHQEPHGMDNNSVHAENKALPVMNTKYITELDEEKRGRTMVKIWIEKGDTTYSISRVLSVLKHQLSFKTLDNEQKVLLIAQWADDKIPQGCEVLPEQSDFVIKEKGPNDVDFRDTGQNIDATVLMNQILPIGLSKYFLLDGEFLEGFWQDTSIIKMGVEQISQLHLLGSLEGHVSDMCTIPKGKDKEVNTLSTRIDLIRWYEKSCDEHGNEKFSQELRWKADPNDEDEYYHASGNPRIKELEDDLQKIKQSISEISKKIGSTSGQNIEHLKNTKIDLEGKIEEKNEDLENIMKEYRYNLITKSPYVFLKKAIEDSVDIIEKRTEAGDLPIRQRKQFAEDLLKRGICICGEKLTANASDPASEKRVDEIKKYKDMELGSDDLDAAVDMKYNFRHELLNQYSNFLKTTFGDRQKNLAKKHEEVDSLMVDLQKTNEQLKNYGGDEIKKLIDDQAQLIDEMEKKHQEISEIKSKLSKDGKQLSDLRIKLHKVLKQNKQYRKLSHAFDVWTRISRHVKQAYDELKDEIRVEVQDTTWKNFKELLTNPSEFDNFTIDSDYSVYLLDEHNTNKIYNLSAGQSLILTLAFVAALREPTGYRFPLVIDSPLGKIDSGNRYNIGICLPKYLPAEQLTLLVTDTEYVANLTPDEKYPNLPITPIAKLLDEKIGLKHFKITKERDGTNKGNSSITAAELAFDEDRKVWAVNAIV